MKKGEAIAWVRLLFTFFISVPCSSVTSKGADDNIVETGEVYGTVGHMIKRMQVDERDERTTDAQDQGAEEKRWFAHVPYELTKENRPGVYRITTLLCCPPLLLFASGQRMYRELWQEG